MHQVLEVLLAVTLIAVATVTLTPAGDGWTWASPAAEVRWYLTGLSDDTTRLQLLGNLTLLMPTAVLLVLRWPSRFRPKALVAIAITVACSIELLQWALPLGRVVSPVDAALNLAGALLAGALTARAVDRVHPGGRPAAWVPGPPLRRCGESASPGGGGRDCSVTVPVLVDGLEEPVDPRHERRLQDRGASAFE